jgi:hypothetical protein
VVQEVADHLDVVALGVPLHDDGPLLAVADDGRAWLLDPLTLTELLLPSLLFIVLVAHNASWLVPPDL